MTEILTVTSTEIEELSSFLAHFEDETRDELYWMNRFNLWWENNPAFEENIERGWILRDGGKIAGFLGNIPTRFQLLGEEETVFNSTTWRVLPEYRNRSMSLMSKLINTAKKSILFNTTPTSDVVKIMEALRFRILPRCSSSRSTNQISLLIVDFKNIAAEKLRDKIFSKTLSRLSAPVLKGYQAIRISKIRSSEITNVKRILKADNTFDELWMRIKDTYLNTNIRTAKIVNWYCFNKIDSDKKLFGYYRNNKLLGYIVCWKSKASKLKEFECLDLWIDWAESNVLHALIGFTAKYAQENLYDVVTFPHFTSQIGKNLKDLGLLSIKVSPKKEYFKINRKLDDRITEANSYFVGIQGDYSLT